ncbi:MAG: PP2C family serine/threonine-protein phosphatase [Microcystaceae cyanobacterium]
MIKTQVWKAIARSAIGVAHQAQSLPCQDYSEYRYLSPGVIIGAVADGAGSASLSHIGSELAVKTSLNYLAKWHKFLQKQPDYPRPLTDLSTDLARHFFGKLVQQVQKKLNEQARQLDCAVNQLATTLLVFIAHPQGAIAMQIGDGFLLIRSPKKDYQLLFQPDKGEFINETAFVTSKSALQDLKVGVFDEVIAFICAATDGVEKVAIRYQDWSPFPPFFEPLEAFLQTTQNPEAEAEYLEQFLQSERLNQRTQDDKTLLLCSRNVL